MKFIIEVDGIVSTRYKYNLWSTVEYEDGAVAADARIEHEDDLDTFMVKLRHQIERADLANKAEAMFGPLTQAIKDGTFVSTKKCSNGETEPCNCAMH